MHGDNLGLVMLHGCKSGLAKLIGGKLGLIILIPSFIAWRIGDVIAHVCANSFDCN